MKKKNLPLNGASFSRIYYKLKHACPTSAHLETLTSTSPTTCVHQLQQFGVDSLSSLLKNPDQITSLPKVSRCEEGVGCTFVGAASCAANAMNIILRRVWIVIVDDKFNILHIFMGPR